MAKMSTAKKSVPAAATAVKAPAPAYVAPKGAPEPVTKTDTSIRAAGVNPLAIKLANKISPATIESLETAVDLNEQQKISGIIVALLLKADFTDDDWQAMPRIDTARNRDGYPDGGNNPDWTEVKDGKRTKWVSFVNTIIGRTPKMVSLDAQIERITDAENKKEGHDKAIGAMGKGERKSMLERIRGQRNTIQSTFRRAFTLVQNERALADTYGAAINFSYVTDAKDNLIPGPKPIILQMAKKPGLFDTFSVTSFNSLDFDKAYAKAGKDATADQQWQAVLDTLSREDGEEGGEDEKNIVIKDTETFLSAGAAMAHFVDKSENLLPLYSKIKNAKDVRDVAHILDTIESLSSEFVAMRQSVEKQIVKLAALRDLKNTKLAEDALTG